MQMPRGAAITSGRRGRAGALSCHRGAHSFRLDLRQEDRILRDGWSDGGICLAQRIRRTSIWTSSGTPGCPPRSPILMRTRTGASFGHPLDPIGLRVQRVRRSCSVIGTRICSAWRSTQSAAATGSQVPGVGCFFSGGVDSFYSALDRHAEITHLIFVHGFDIPFDDDRLASEALTAARAAARELGKPLISVRTDIRRVSDPWSGWGEHYHGAALATVGLLLADHVRAGDHSVHVLGGGCQPVGFAPQLDPLWSTSRVTLRTRRQ